MAIGSASEQAFAWCLPGRRPVPADRARQRWRGAAVVVASCALIASPAAAVALLVAAWCLPGHLAARRAAARRAAIERELPLVVELFAIAAHAGLTVPQAVVAIAAQLEGEVGQALQRVAGAHGRGVRMAEALGELAAALGPTAGALAATLAAGLRDGDPLAPALDRLADASRAAERRRGEVVARRLSVQLLVPLVLCVLPAFALLTVVPVLLVSLRSLPR